MENNFEKIMSERTDEELIKIITVEREDYQPLAIQIAEKEIEKRNIDTSKIYEIREKTIVEKKEKDEVDSNRATSLTRFLNFIIDIVAFLILVLIIGFVFDFIVPREQNIPIEFIGYLIIIGSFFVYYIFLENKYQKTIGKFITKTKVVTKLNEKPELKDIIIRTFCRLIPFDRISYLFMKNGIHDTLSNTIVIKDKTE